MREAARLRLTEGLSLELIGDRLGVTRQTVSQWLRKINAETLAELEAETPASLIAETVRRLRSIHDDSLRRAATAKSERLAAALLNTAARTIQQEVDLMLATGLLPRQPEKLFVATAELRPEGVRADGEDEPPRTKRDLILDLLQKMERSPRL